jgi:cadmium resistance protein CadD (predicted permease)
MSKNENRVLGVVLLAILASVIFVPGYLYEIWEGISPLIGLGVIILAIYLLNGGKAKREEEKRKKEIEDIKRNELELEEYKKRIRNESRDRFEY